MKCVCKILLIVALVTLGAHNVSAATTASTARANVLIREKTENMKKVLGNAVTNLERISSRIESQITKIQGRGKDTSASTAALAQAKTKVSAARIALQAIVSLTASSTDPRGTLKTLKSLNEAARKAIKEAGQSLVGVTKTLRVDAGTEARLHAE